MSAALLKKSLELCDTPFVVVRQEQLVRYKPATSKSKPKKTQRGLADVQRKNINCIEQVKAKRKQEKQKQETIRQKLDILKKPILDDKLAKKILESTKKRGTRSGDLIYLDDKASELKSAFTEEDFEKFEREYQDDG